MSKELTPLKALKELKKRYGKNFSLNDDERCRVVETELKESNELRTRHYELLKESEHFYNERNKYKKALQLFKEKRVDVYVLLCSTKLVDYNCNFSEEFHLIQEEYKFLKEILK